MKILKTDKEIAREERNNLVVARFVAFREEYPSATMNRIFNALAADQEITGKYGILTPQTIRSICKTAGVC